MKKCFRMSSIYQPVIEAKSVFFSPLPEINVVTLVTRESSGFYTVQSELQYKVAKEDKDALFSCEVSYYVPEGVRTAKSKVINITVHCKKPTNCHIPQTCYR